MEITMRRVLTAAVLAALLGNPVFAQVGGMGNPTPGIGGAPPLATAPGSPVAPTGIPMGATGLASPGLSPPPAGAMSSGTSGNGTTCSAMGSPSPGMSGSGATYDGGGMTTGTGASLPGSAA